MQSQHDTEGWYVDVKMCWMCVDVWMCRCVGCVGCVDVLDVWMCVVVCILGCEEGRMISKSHIEATHIEATQHRCFS